MENKKKWENHEGVILDSVKGFDVIQCQNCGFNHVIPIPSEEEKEDYYKFKFIYQRDALLKRMKEDLEWWNSIHAEKYNYFEQLLGRKGRLLDIGCGMGFFLKVGKEREWDVLGLEPSQQSYENASSLGVTVINEGINSESVNQIGTFDVIHMHEVLEHLPNPYEVIQLCRGLLEHDGLLSISVPNDYNPLQKLLQKKLGFPSWWVAPEVHLNYFNFESLESLFEKNGFDVVLKTSSFPLELFLLMGDNYIGNDTLGRECHTKRKNLELNLQRNGCTEFKQKLYAHFADVGIGREITMIGKKR